MTAMMIDDGKRVAAGWARLQWHMIPIADIDLIARNTGNFDVTRRRYSRKMRRDSRRAFWQAAGWSEISIQQSRAEKR
jgi:hypothetical protein